VMEMVITTRIKRLVHLSEKPSDKATR